MSVAATSLGVIAASTALLLNAVFAAESSCTAHSSVDGTPRTCSITCQEGKQAVCEEGVAGREPQCRCADKSTENNGADDEPPSEKSPDAP